MSPVVTRAARTMQSCPEVVQLTYYIEHMLCQKLTAAVALVPSGSVPDPLMLLRRIRELVVQTDPNHEQ